MRSRCTPDVRRHGSARGAAVGALSLANRDEPVAVNAPHLAIGGATGPVLGWGWVGFRALVLGLAVWWTIRAWRGEGRAGVRRGQLSRLLAAVVSGAAGGIVTILGRQLGGAEWPGTTLIAASLGLTAYAVFAGRVFLDPAVARRSFLYSLGAGVVTAGYVGALLGLERLARRLLAIDTPLVTALALVLTIALFDPVRGRLRALLDRRAERRERAYRRLLRALGDELLTAQRPEAAVAPALARLCRTLEIGGAAVVDAGGETVARFGAGPPAESPLTLVLPPAAPARGSGAGQGVQVIFGPKRSGQPYTRAETDLLSDAAAFIAASLGLAERQASQAAALDALTQ